MRCIFVKGKQRVLLLFAKNSLGISWRDMADELDVGYTTLRDWRDERYSMRCEAFQKLVEMHPRCKDFRDFIVDLREDNWGRRLGGFRAKQKKRGFFDPKHAKQRRLWRSNGGKIVLRRWHARMKANKPSEYRRTQQQRLKQSLKYKYKYHGQKFRNILELNIAKILTENSVKFEYEPMLNCEGKIYFPDFMINNVIIECTFWHDIKQRAKELRRKIDDYLKLKIRDILIVTLPKYIDGYSKLLDNPNVMVITPETLRNMLGGSMRAGREGSRKLSTEA
jgi:hypothetical protein